MSYRVIKTQTWVCAPGDQSELYTFPENRPQVLEPQEGERLCSICLSLGQLPSEYWDNINNFRDVFIPHHYSVSTLIDSALGGCHFCNLLLKAWEETCRLSQDSNGHWVARLGTDIATLGDWIILRFQRAKQLLQITGVHVDEVQISILCGDMPPEMRGKLICYPMNGMWVVCAPQYFQSLTDVT